MTSQEVIAVHLDEGELDRVDTLARLRGVERDEAIVALVRTGLSACERALEIQGDGPGKGMSHPDR